ncbi:MAG: DUF4160 domain-containing protein [Phormidesmis sp.]
MPTVFSYSDVTVTIEVRDEHPPMHVHVRSSDYRIRVNIENEPYVMRESTKNCIKTNRKFDKEALEQVAAKIDECRRVWRAYNG